MQRFTWDKHCSHRSTERVSSSYAPIRGSKSHHKNARKGKQQGHTISGSKSKCSQGMGERRTVKIAGDLLSQAVASEFEKPPTPTGSARCRGFQWPASIVVEVDALEDLKFLFWGSDERLCSYVVTCFYKSVDHLCHRPVEAQMAFEEQMIWSNLLLTTIVFQPTVTRWRQHLPIRNSSPFALFLCLSSYTSAKRPKRSITKSYSCFL